MTSSMAPRPVDLDLLADYVGGALDAAANTEIAALIAHDARWSAAHAALRAALDEVGTELREYAAADEPMPAGAAARITGALREEAARARTGSGHSAGHRRRLVLAAGALVVVALGVGVAIPVLHAKHGDAGLTASAGAAVAPAEASGNAAAGGTVPPAPFGAQSVLTGVTITASGQAYSAATLRSATVPGPLVTLPVGPAPAASPDSTTAETGPSSPSVPASLAPLLSAGPLGACVAAIEAATGTAVTAVDFARYDATPALIVTLADGGRFVAGAGCGRPGQGSDELAHS